MSLLTNKYFWIILISIIVVISLIWYFYDKGKGSATIVSPVLDNPNSSDNSNNPDGLSDSSLKQIVDTAHTDATSYWQSFSGHNANAYIPFTTLSDTDFEKAYDIWNNEYQSVDQKTMRGVIDGIWGSWADGIIIGDATSFSTIQQSIDDRFNRLSLA